MKPKPIHHFVKSNKDTLSENLERLTERRFGTESNLEFLRSGSKRFLAVSYTFAKILKTTKGHVSVSVVLQEINQQNISK